jgi:hypothetical protein
VSKNNPTTIPIERIEHKILLVRGNKVIIDADLASLYGVSTKRLNEQVKRNKERFPNDFMFQLTANEKHQVVAICDHLSKLKYSRTNPYVFTEHGAIMAASIINTKWAVEVSILVVRTFVKFRTMLAADKELRHKLKKIEDKIINHDEIIQALAKIIRQLMQAPKSENKRTIGFAAWRR